MPRRDSVWADIPLTRRARPCGSVRTHRPAPVPPLESLPGTRPHGALPTQCAAWREAKHLRRAAGRRPMAARGALCPQMRRSPRRPSEWSSIIRRSHDESRRYIFGIPGEENIDVMDALVDSSIRFVTTHHERGAAFMAEVYGRLTGRAGVWCARGSPTTRSSSSIAPSTTARA